MSRVLLAGSLAMLGALLWGCPKPVTEMEAFKPRSLKDYSKPLPPGALALRKIDPSRYPDFGLGFDNLAGLEQAIRNSLAYLAKPSAKSTFPTAISRTSVPCGRWSDSSTSSTPSTRRRS